MNHPTPHSATSSPLPDVCEQVARRHPLVPRGKPPCPPLTTRLQQIRTRVDSARQDGDSDQRLLYAAQAHNLAALTASDCGLPDLARELCARQAGILLNGAGYDADTAKLALQPLINLARLLIRDGEGEAAHRHFEHLLAAARARTSTVIADIPVDFSDLTATPDDHRTIIQWLWTTVLSDGTRALTQTGHWPQALEHAQRRNAIGQRLFDGRQAAVLAHSAAGGPDHALQLLDDSHTPTQWEQAIASTLRVPCLFRSNQDATPAIDEMLDRYVQVEETIREHPVFHIRLGLCVIDLATGFPETHHIIKTVVRAALDAEDASLAHDVLAHTCQAQIDTATAAKLQACIDVAGFNKGALTAEDRRDLLDASRDSERVLNDELGHTPVPGQITR
ncbi:hypothetical protein [Nocardiopsis coralliicola]